MFWVHKGYKQVVYKIDKNIGVIFKDYEETHVQLNLIF